MPGNTANQLPYPLATEAVAQGAQAIQNLAQAVDTRSGVRAQGRATVNFHNSVTAVVTVTFASGRFQAGASPQVVAMGAAAYASQVNCGVYSPLPSNTSAAITVRSIHGNAVSWSGVQIMWIAHA